MKHHLIIDLETGSSGKGYLAQEIAKQEIQKEKKNFLLISDNAPNADHEILIDGKEFNVVVLPCSAFTLSETDLEYDILLGSFCSFYLPTLKLELEKLKNKPKNLFIDVRAWQIGNEDTRMQHLNNFTNSLISFPSTVTSSHFQKTTKILRQSQNIEALAILIKNIYGESFKISSINAFDFFDKNTYDSIIIEQPQGYQLSVDGSFFPQTTSRNIGTLDTLFRYPFIKISDLCVYGIIRYFPIISGAEEKKGKQVQFFDSIRFSEKEMEKVQETCKVSLKKRIMFKRGPVAFNSLLKAIQHNLINILFITHLDYLDVFGCKDQLKDLKIRKFYSKKAGVFIEY